MQTRGCGLTKTQVRNVLMYYAIVPPFAIETSIGLLRNFSSATHRKGLHISMHIWEHIKTMQMEWMKTAGDKAGLETLKTKGKKRTKKVFETGTGNKLLTRKGKKKQF
jgi:hypothetical protein